MNPPTDPIQLAKDLTETMLQNNGIGIAANQCGLPYRVFAIRSNPVLVCFNPRIVDLSSEELYLEEGCLTFPNYYVKVKRPKKIKVRFTMPNGQVDTRIFDGMTARIFQHELDHLDGILFMSRATKYHRDQAEKKARKAA
jgi:peptide deformylase